MNSDKIHGQCKVFRLTRNSLVNEKLKDNIKLDRRWVCIRKDVNDADDVRVCCQTLILEVLNVGSTADVSLTVVSTAKV